MKRLERKPHACCPGVGDQLAQAVYGAGARCLDVLVARIDAAGDEHSYNFV